MVIDNDGENKIILTGLMIKNFGEMEHVTRKSKTNMFTTITDPKVIFNLQNEKEYYKSIICYISGMTDTYIVQKYNQNFNRKYFSTFKIKIQLKFGRIKCF